MTLEDHSLRVQRQPLPLLLVDGLPLFVEECIHFRVLDAKIRLEAAVPAIGVMGLQLDVVRQIGKVRVGGRFEIGYEQARQPSPDFATCEVHVHANFGQVVLYDRGAVSVLRVGVEAELERQAVLLGG
jgi:hypothetical protein